MYLVASCQWLSVAVIMVPVEALHADSKSAISRSSDRAQMTLESVSDLKMGSTIYKEMQGPGITQAVLNTTKWGPYTRYLGAIQGGSNSDI
jgi:hypothetical protein